MLAAVETNAKLLGYNSELAVDRCLERVLATNKRRTTMKFRNLMLAVFGLALLAGSAVPANAAYHHHRHHRHHHHA